MRTPKKQKKAILFHAGRLGAFTNESAYAIRLEETTWPTVTHYLLYKQYCLPEYDVCYRDYIDDLYEYIKSSNRKCHHKWDVNRDEWLLNGLRAKFSQHLDLEDMLKRTASALLVYINPEDTYLGTNPDGTGDNMLGRMLMRVRSELGKPIMDRANRIEDRGIYIKYPGIASQKGSIKHLVELAVSYLECAEFQLALKAAKEAVEVDNDCEEAHRIAAYVLILKGQYEIAVKSVKDCLRLNPHSAQYYRWMSLCCEQMDRAVAATLYANQARRLEGMNNG